MEDQARYYVMLEELAEQRRQEAAGEDGEEDEDDEIATDACNCVSADIVDAIREGMGRVASMTSTDQYVKQVLGELILPAVDNDVPGRSNSAIAAKCGITAHFLDSAVARLHEDRQIIPSLHDVQNKRGVLPLFRKTRKDKFTKDDLKILNLTQYFELTCAPSPVSYITLHSLFFLVDTALLSFLLTYCLFFSLLLLVVR